MSILIGICHVNSRQYCTGVWTSVEQLQQELPECQIVKANPDCDLFAEGADAVYKVFFTGRGNSR